ncbi:MAG: UMP kinase [Candidatus Magasanikbacteria bacterium]|jgi:uridylate kinase|nr:UMP kinase [Candidatus Magasanikbacteria bacterium]MBT4314768.1 UMP kinase [Candidatus Magasanikbacteria bacterium]MBT4547545.1 UMP kinase [Candidatus Magasanikbacteria bacterium]MBT6819389.1 UMP kinase [Candidatus Magasanikbacteria bacterium]
MKNNYKIISVGGSIVIPKTGFDINFLKKFKALILRQVKKGDKFILVIGGGATCRNYQQAAGKVSKLSNDDLDWIGIHSITFNAQFVKYMFKDHAYKEIVLDPNKKVKTNKSIIIAGALKPGCSSDKDAVLLAKTYGAKEVINLSNIEYVYDKDPNKYKNAKKIEETNWKDFRKDVVGYKWVPGKNVPFDPMASALAEKLGLKVSILKGTSLKEVEKVISGKKFKGTVVK